MGYPLYIVSVHEVYAGGLLPFEVYRYGDGQAFDVISGAASKVVAALDNAKETLSAMRTYTPSKEGAPDECCTKT